MVPRVLHAQPCLDPRGHLRRGLGRHAVRTHRHGSRHAGAHLLRREHAGSRLHGVGAARRPAVASGDVRGGFADPLPPGAAAPAGVAAVRQLPHALPAAPGHHPRAADRQPGGVLRPDATLVAGCLPAAQHCPGGRVRLQARRFRPLPDAVQAAPARPAHRNPQRGAAGRGAATSRRGWSASSSRSTASRWSRSTW